MLRTSAFITAAKYVSFKNNPYLHQHKLQSVNSSVCFSGPTLVDLSAALGTVDDLSSCNFVLLALA